jgi:hypothetical protein
VISNPARFSDEIFAGNFGYFRPGLKEVKYPEVTLLSRKLAAKACRLRLHFQKSGENGRHPVNHLIVDSYRSAVLFYHSVTWVARKPMASLK